jgi:Cof subfamily protein (haloacid dehalogenase superfamily)
MGEGERQRSFPPAHDVLPGGLLPGGRFADWRPRAPGYVVCDVDGTLVGAAPRATEAVESAVRDCVDAGLAVGLATGRMPGACGALAAQLGLTGPHVLHNGAVVRHRGEQVQSWPLEPGSAAALAALCARRGLYAEFFVDAGYWATDRRVAARFHWEVSGQEPHGLIADLDLDRTVVDKATVLLFGDDDEAAVLAEVGDLGLVGGIARMPGRPAVAVNVTRAEIDKGSALAVAAGAAGCELDQVVAVGDGDNDLPMLAVAGTAIAMGQASPAVREAAHLIAPELAADGVAHALHAAAAWARGRDEAGLGRPARG